MQRTILYLAAWLLPALLSGQMQLGWRADNYSGINSALLNPAAPLNTPYSWDLNLMEGSVFAANNYAYVRQTSLGKLFNTDENTNFVSAPDADGETKPGDVIIDYFNNNRTRFASVQWAYLGPSLSVRVAPLTRVGVFTRFRSMLSARKIDEDLSYYIFTERPFNTPTLIDPFQVATAIWGELGLNVAQGIPLANDAQLNLGLSIRRLYGYEGGYAANERSFEYTRLSQNTLTGQAPTLSAAFTDSAIESDNYSPAANGKGWGFDLGFQYVATDGDGGYRWRVGASLLDAGRITFDQNAQLHEVSVDSLVRLRTDFYQSYSQIGDVDAIIRQFSADVLADSFASLTATSFKLGLPTVLSLQWDMAITPELYVGVVWAGNVASNKGSLQQGSVLAITPRWERYWWGVSMPVTLYEWQQARIGLALRLGPFTIGSDHLGGWLGQQRLSGGDLYTAIKIFPWGLRSSQRKSASRGGARRGKEVECYKF